jgi:tRNA 2-selenouridine synthase
MRKTHPVVDVRSPGEFLEGHIKDAFNIPLLNNEERVAVGTDYKQKGRAEAIKTGFRLVGPRLLEIVNEAERVAQGKEILVHCWRGGMRSANFCQFVAMAGIKSYSLEGGYKSYRHAAIESYKQPFKFILLTGFTGSGKSEILRLLKEEGEQILDLEGLANHKGSAFGGLLMPPQPTTEQFQNNLFEDILQLDTSKRIWVEDESIAIGKIFIPQYFWLRMTESPLVQMKVEKEVRVGRLVTEYGASDREEFLKMMERVTKKLGGQNFKAAKEKLLAGDMASTIDLLLTYYDKAYMTSIERRKERVQFDLSWNGKEPQQYAKALIESVKAMGI